MIDRFFVRRLLLSAATGLALAVTGVAAPVVDASLTPAIAQSADDMAAALDAYGHWVRHARYGEVWVPDGVPSDWQPYEYGYWVYTDDWGWYWVSDESEDDWGWVVYHYGRWVHDRGSWFWVPGDEWAPAWVDWRYGGDDIGWAPLPPDDLIDAYDVEPDYWLFVPLRYIGESQLREHFLPRERRTLLLRDTHVINRPVRIEGRRLWVNPGLAPAFIAGRTHVTLHAYQVRPRVFGATTGVQGAVTVRQQDLRIKGALRRAAPITVQRTNVTIQATTSTAAPKVLGKGEHGHLGSQPPRAAQGGAQQQQQQQQQPKGPTGTPPRTGAPVIQHPGGPAPVVTPTAPVQTKPVEKHEERREAHPPAGAGGPPPQPKIVHPPSPPPPPIVHAPPPPVVHAPPPPAVRAPPPPVVHAPPPPAAHAPPPPKAPEAKRPPPKPGEKPPEPPK